MAAVSGFKMFLSNSFLQTPSLCSLIFPQSDTVDKPGLNFKSVSESRPADGLLQARSDVLLSLSEQDPAGR